MKHTNKILGTMLLAALVTTSCVDDEQLQYAFEKPASIAGYEYLADYDALKTYVNRTASPNFKLGGALAASDYNADGLVTRLANSNFDEVVAGNAMKMASCVGEKGEMDFGTVETFVSKATENGLNVYGHTLAWHAQQPKKWLERLIKDKELDIDPDAKIWKDDYFIDYTTYSSFPFYNMGYAPDFSAEEGLISLSDAGWYQYFAADQMGLPEGQKYKITVTYKSPVDATVKCILRWDWGDGAMEGNLNLPATDEWQEAEIEYGQPLGASGGFVVFQLSGLQNQRICFKNLKASHSESPAVEVEQEVGVQTYTDGPFPFYAMGCEPPVINKAIHFEPTGGWSQFFCFPGINNLGEGDYVVYLDLQSNKDAGGLQLTMQNGWSPESQNVSVGLTVKAGRQNYRLQFPGLEGGNYDCILKPQTADATLDLYSVTVCKVVKMNSIPLTDEEKKDTLTWAMEQWISGMMKACDGKVKAWDVVNEAISGGNPDAEGVYALQHADPAGSPNDFFWQDYLGDLDYVRTAVRLARQYGGNDLKLFVNDYNLESDWDNNGKLRSLIKWIERWESDGVTKIDGIGTQMHISCSLNPNTLKSRKEHITKMFEMMRDSKKLVRVSELDMGLDDANGNPVKTSEMTEEMHKAMAEHYKFVVSEYLRIIPAAQQWGICQWCITDSPASSGWRADTPTGLWDLNYNRKHTYAGFADGLSGK